MELNVKKIFVASVCLTIIGALGLFFESTQIRADSSKKSGRDTEIQNQESMIISQNEPEKPGEKEKEDRSAADKDPDAQNRDSKIKAEKDFTPSIQIDADYAIAFPYDI